MGSGGRMEEWWLSIEGFNPTCRHFENLDNLVHICLCPSEETLNAGDSLYLVSMPGEVKDPTQGVNV